MTFLHCAFWNVSQRYLACLFVASYPSSSSCRNKKGCHQQKSWLLIVDFVQYCFLFICGKSSFIIILLEQKVATGRKAGQMTLSAWRILSVPHLLIQKQSKNGDILGGYFPMKMHRECRFTIHSMCHFFRVPFGRYVVAKVSATNN